ncbi:hypothetical protein ACC792_37900, partial [Rhizobium ruizarguesonis]
MFSRSAIRTASSAWRSSLLGTLFRQKGFERQETELVIIATTYLVRPVARNQLSRPDDDIDDRRCCRQQQRLLRR